VDLHLSGMSFSPVGIEIEGDDLVAGRRGGGVIASYRVLDNTE
jgi:hypothetical protein